MRSYADGDSERAQQRGGLTGSEGPKLGGFVIAAGEHPAATGVGGDFSDRGSVHAGVDAQDGGGGKLCGK